jgi:CheY-like chemotaxis protein
MRKSTILLAEDYDDTREIYQAALEAAGYTVAVAKTPRDALKRLRTVKPALVMMDLGMHGEGFSVAGSIAALPKAPPRSSPHTTTATTLAPVARIWATATRRLLRQPDSLANRVERLSHARRNIWTAGHVPEPLLQFPRLMLRERGDARGGGHGQFLCDKGRVGKTLAHRFRQAYTAGVRLRSEHVMPDGVGQHHRDFVVHTLPLACIRRVYVGRPSAALKLALSPQLKLPVELVARAIAARRARRDRRGDAAGDDVEKPGANVGPGRSSHGHSRGLTVFVHFTSWLTPAVR